MANDLRYLVNNNSSTWVAKSRPDRAASAPPVVVTPPTNTTPPRPEGAKYVRYEDTYVSGDNLQQTLNRVTGNRVLTFPEGEFIIPPNFSNGYMDGVRVGNGGAGGCNGIAGSGRNTIFKMLSSNRPQPAVGTTITTNNYFLMQANGESWPGGKRPGMEFQNFWLQGTLLGADHDFNGLRFDSCQDLLVKDVLVTGVKGTDNVPPGETGGISLFRNAGGLIKNTEIDGRRDGVRVSSAPLMPNNGSNLTVEDCYFHHSRYGGGGIAWYVYDGGIVRNTRSEYIGSGTGIRSGYCFNHEQANNITYYNPIMVCDRNASGGNGTLHMSLNADSARAGVDNTLTVYNPTWDATSVGNGKFVVETWNLGTQQVQRKRPTVYNASGVLDPNLVFYINPYLTNPNP